MTVPAIPPIPPIPPAIQKLLALIGPFIETCKSFYNRTLPVRTYRRLIDDMVTFKPEDEKIKGAAAVKEVKPDGVFKINIVYLDAENNPVWDDGKKNDYSFAISAKKLDDELTQAFGDKTVIVFN